MITDCSPQTQKSSGLVSHSNGEQRKEDSFCVFPLASSTSSPQQQSKPKFAEQYLKGRLYREQAFLSRGIMSVLESSRQKNAEHEQFEKEKAMLSPKSSVWDCVVSDLYRYTPTR